MNQIKSCCSDVQNGFSDERISVREYRRAMIPSRKFSRFGTGKLEGRVDTEQYWLELDDIHELIRKLDEEDAG